MQGYYTYILLCADKSLYTGYTTDPKRRLGEHEAGEGARYTRGRGPLKMVYLERSLSKGQAMSREALIKRLSKKEKLGLIEEEEKRSQALMKKLGIE